MSRSNKNPQHIEYNEEDFKERRIVKNPPSSFCNKERVHFVDADSLLFICTYSPIDKETGEIPELEFEEVTYRLREKLAEIQLNIEEFYNIKQTFLFVGGKNNFRYKLYPEYKSNRKSEKPKWFYELKDYLINELGAIPAIQGEADDLIYESYKMSEGNCVISTIDKDIMINAPNTPLYNYRSYDDVVGEWKQINTKESRLAIATQVICGDTTDFIKGAFGVGKAWCDKHLHENMSNYQFVKNILGAYLKANKGNMKQAKEDAKLNYKLLKLYTQEEINALLL